MKTVRQSAAVKEQQVQLKQLKEGSKGNPITIEEVRTGRPQTSGGGAPRNRDKSIRYRKGGIRGTQPRMQGGARLVQRKSQCKRCGKDHLPGERCPAKAEDCCSQRRGAEPGHCISRSLKLWKDFTLKLEGTDIHFKMDTGAEITAISGRTFKSLKGVTLTKPTKILYGPAGRQMKVLGQFTGTLSSKDKQVNEPVYVIRGLRTNLLGLPAITVLKLVSRIDATSSTEQQDWLAQYPSLF